MKINTLFGSAFRIVAPLMLIPLSATALGPHILRKHVDGSLRGFSAPSGATLTYYGGRVVSNVEVVQVLWGQGSYSPEVTSTGTPSMASFYTNVVKSPYMDWLTEYNTPNGTRQTIGHGTFLGQYQITPSTNASSVTDDTIQAELSAQIAAGRLPRPSTDSLGNNNTYYAIFFPSGKTISLGGQGSCQVFCAYHGTVPASQSIGEYYYGVHPDFQSGSGCDMGCGASSKTFNNITSVASHELIETVTDAEVGIAANLAAPLAWYNNSYGEIGDICNADQGSVVGADGVTYTVQKEYSNALKDCIVSKSTVGSAPRITSGNNSVFIAGTANSFTITATGNPAPRFSVSGTLPSGVSLSSSGLLSGTPVQGTGGVYPITITASNGTLPNATQSFSLSVQDFKVAVSPSAQSVTAGKSVNYSVTFTALGSMTGTLYSSCAGGPAGTTCTTSPSTTTLRGTSTQTATLKTTTTARKGTYTVVFKGRIGSTTRYGYGTITVK